MLNPFFLQGSKTEQGLIQDLVNETIRMHGIDVYYLPRKYITEKTIIKEVIESHFTNAYPIEAYVDSYEGYGGQGTLLSKFGIQEIDDVTLIISKERWEVYIEPLIKNIPDIKLSSRPKEGDLIYFPLGDRLFEIKYVEHEKPFYQLQKNYVYELRCELFRYQDEVINTNIEFIDDNIENEGYIQSLRLVSLGSTATATSTIVNGGVRYVVVTNRGSGYTEPPLVAFSSAPFGGRTATGIASMIGGIVDICEPDENLFRVQAVNLTNSGAGYTTPPMVSFIGGGGSGAQATAYIGDGIVGIVSITNMGSGYTTPPSVSFIGISSEPASGYSVINSSGNVTSIIMTNSGLGYSESPQIIISDPPLMVGFGTYIYNEIVVGSSSSTTARVRSWNALENILEVATITGDFVIGEIIVGQESGASYSMIERNTYNIEYRDSNENINRGDGFAQNEVFEEESIGVLDFSESNPFGNP
jgi:hypothetical protein